jgi:hypothetical protein
MFTHVASCEIPAFPGAQKICFTDRLWAIFHTRACSLPPLPTTSIFIISPLGHSVQVLVFRFKGKADQPVEQFAETGYRRFRGQRKKAGPRHPGDGVGFQDVEL